jgi:aromatic ring-cleaving dioxygenase
MKVYTIEEIREALGDRNIRMVAQRIGVHEQTLYNIRWGNQEGMNTSTYAKLVPYLFGNNEGTSNNQKVE